MPAAARSPLLGRNWLLHDDIIPAHRLDMAESRLPGRGAPGLEPECTPPADAAAAALAARSCSESLVEERESAR